MARQRKYFPVMTTICLIEIVISYYFLELWPGPRYMCVCMLLLLVTKREKIYFCYIRVATILDILLLSVSSSQQTVCGMVPSNAL